MRRAAAVDRSAMRGSRQLAHTGDGAHHQTEVESVLIALVPDGGCPARKVSVRRPAPISRVTWKVGTISPRSQCVMRGKSRNRCGRWRRKRCGGPYPAALECPTDSRATIVAAADLTLMRSLRYQKEPLFNVLKPRESTRSVKIAAVPHSRFIQTWNTPVNNFRQRIATILTFFPTTLLTRAFPAEMNARSA